VLAVLGEDTQIYCVGRSTGVVRCKIVVTRRQQVSEKIENTDVDIWFSYSLLKLYVYYSLAQMFINLHICKTSCMVIF